MPRYRNLAVLALTILLSLPAIAAPTQHPDAPLLARIARFIKHLAPGFLDDITFPRP